MKSTKRSSRRRFLVVAGAAAAATAIAPAELLAQATKKATQTKQPATKAPADTKPPAKPVAAKADTTKPAAEQTPPDIKAEAEHFLAIVQARYGKHLDAKQVEAVKTELEQRVTNGRRLRAVKLKNHEEPDFTFRA
jgi:hypothetical protein